MEENFGEEFGLKKSIYERVNKRLDMASDLRLYRVLNNWYDCLLSLSSDVEYLFNSDEKKKNFGIQKLLDPLHTQYTILLARGTLHRFQEWAKFYGLLQYYEIFLRGVCKRVGIL